MKENGRFTFEEKPQKKKRVWRNKNVDLQFMLDLTKLSRVSLQIGHCHLCLEGHLKVCLQSLYIGKHLVEFSPLFKSLSIFRGLVYTVQTRHVHFLQCVVYRPDIFSFLQCAVYRLDVFIFYSVYQKSLE